ncbi:MAG: zinc-binding dehydrogenase [Chloroflexi bacterium]|nr:zinc-binding dehydrogenase [Chloroflexota bacterium]
MATGVGAVINTAKVQPCTTVAVFGAGGVGLNCIQGASISSASIIIAVDLLDSKLELAREFGATHTINASDGNVVEANKGAHGRRRRSLCVRIDRTSR